MTDQTYQKFVQRWEEVTDIPPQALGPLTNIYKFVTKKLKVMPWPWYLIAASGMAVGLYWLFGTSVSTIVTLLQRGF